MHSKCACSTAGNLYRVCVCVCLCHSRAGLLGRRGGGAIGWHCFYCFLYPNVAASVLGRGHDSYTTIVTAGTRSREHSRPARAVQAQSLNRCMIVQQTAARHKPRAAKMLRVHTTCTTVHNVIFYHSRRQPVQMSCLLCDESQSLPCLVISLSVLPLPSPVLPVSLPPSQTESKFAKAYAKGVNKKVKLVDDGQVG